MRSAVCALAALLVALATSLARAAEVRVPLTIDYLTLGEAIRHQLYTAPGDRAALVGIFSVVAYSVAQRTTE